jgi:hypothetical protein
MLTQLGLQTFKKRRLLTLRHAQRSPRRSAVSATEDRAMIKFTRRQALATLGCLGASLGTSACSLPITPFCPTDPTISDPSAPLTIDAHTHVFNGSDLQIRGFFTRILATNNSSFQGFGEILQELGRDFAPTANEEMVELQRIAGVIRLCDFRATSQMMGSYRQAGYNRAVKGLKAAARRARLRGLTHNISAEVERQIDALPESLARYKTLRRHNAALSPESITVAGGIDFIIRNFQFRYVNVYDYLLEYSQGKKRRIDLLVAHLVDFDWPIGNGTSTPTSLRDQVIVMEQISRLAGGRVLCFVTFDPMKEVAYALGVSPSSSLQLVKDAVLNHGFIGVKLYPPMGFAPFGNTALGANFWNQAWIPASLHRGDMGARLDQALAELYSWCQSNGVLIMAHTSPTNGPSKSFEGLTEAKYWRKVRKAFSGIRIDFSHFGDTDLVSDKGQRAQRLCKLMTAGESSSGQFFYADAAYFADLLSQPVDLKNQLVSLMRDTAKNGDAALAQRLMYGTDWEMIVVEGPESEQYLQRFEVIYGELDHDSSLGAYGKLSDRFFGENASIFLGLREGQPNRTRLDAYYGIGTKPAWMSKVDNLAVV